MHYPEKRRKDSSKHAQGPGKCNFVYALDRVMAYSAHEPEEDRSTVHQCLYLYMVALLSRRLGEEVSFLPFTSVHLAPLPYCGN